MKLPERLQLPTLDDCSTGNANPFGQVENRIDSTHIQTTSSKTPSTFKQDDQMSYIKPLLFLIDIPIKSKQTQMEILDTNNLSSVRQTPLEDSEEIIKTDSPGSSNLGLHDNIPNKVKKESTDQKNFKLPLIIDKQNTNISLQKILSSLTLDYLHSQKNLEPLLELQRTINFLQNLYNKQGKSKLKQQMDKTIDAVLTHPQELERNKDKNLKSNQNCHIAQNLQKSLSSSTKNTTNTKVVPESFQDKTQDVTQLKSTMPTIHSSINSLPVSEPDTTVKTKFLLDKKPLLSQLSNSLNENLFPPPSSHFNPTNLSPLNLHNHFSALDSNILGMNQFSMLSQCPKHHSSLCCNRSFSSTFSSYNLNPQPSDLPSLFPFNLLKLSHSSYPSYVVMPNLS